METRAGNLMSDVLAVRLAAAQASEVMQPLEVWR
jgi:hypothetical protein